MCFLNEQIDSPSRIKLTRLLELITSSQHNLTSVRDFERATIVHVEDSLKPFCGSTFRGRFVDIGSGGGIPGLVLAIAFPEAEWVLVDSIAKKTKEIERFAHELELKNVVVKTARAEELALEEREKFDAAFMRAVARCDTSLELATPLVKTGGIVYLYKGPGWCEEKVFSRVAEEKLGLGLLQEKEYCLSDGSIRFMIVYAKKRETPDGFPRRCGMASKSPLGGSK